ncbi:MAG TPA: cytochrome C oxidase subunit IV family protein [Acidimicrobiales bacterium]|nr:cytochrome C oxidase subunit IV family protein [Acidimicrobiales bacterium]
MSVAETEHKGAQPEPHHEAHQKTHPSDWLYIKVALLLGVLTAVEVSTYYWENASTGTLVAVLFPLMIVKFGVVVAYFMHLRYDNPLFRRVFVFGLMLAVVVYLVALTAMQFWSDSWSLI